MFDNLGRPSWDSYYIALCYAIASRSLDPRTKCGCIIVDDKNRPLSFGYNSPPRGSIDENIPLQAPEKYFYMEHAERNAIYNCNTYMENGTAYITGFPCFRCLRALIQKGIKRIVYGPNVAISTQDPEQEKACQNLLAGQGIEIVEYKDIDFVDVFLRVFKYMKIKNLDIEQHLRNKGIILSKDFDV
jgi:dCMP deaminase